MRHAEHPVVGQLFDLAEAMDHFQTDITTASPVLAFARRASRTTSALVRAFGCPSILALPRGAAPQAPQSGPDSAPLGETHNPVKSLE